MKALQKSSLVLAAFDDELKVRIPNLIHDFSSVRKQLDSIVDEYLSITEPRENPH